MAIPSNISTAGSVPTKVSYLANEREVTFLEEKQARVAAIDIEKQEENLKSDAEEDEDDIDALIEELESTDPREEVIQEIEARGIETVPEEFLQTDVKFGLTEPEVSARRRKYGLNQMKEERENLFIKFLMYFVGPIQFVMEASNCWSINCSIF